MKRIAYILLSTILFSCSSTKELNPKTTSIELQLGKLEKFIILENQHNSVEVTRHHFVDISENIYPFIKNHDFEISKDFMFMPERNVELRTNYYYTKENDVKLIFYTWTKSDTSEVHKKLFRQIFEKLESEITNKLGKYSAKNIESKTTKSDETFRDDIKWDNSEVNVYMYRFGDKRNSFNEINLVIYKD